jgi:hypothetical protein
MTDWARNANRTPRDKLKESTLRKILDNKELSVLAKAIVGVGMGFAFNLERLKVSLGEEKWKKFEEKSINSPSFIDSVAADISVELIKSYQRTSIWQKAVISLISLTIILISLCRDSLSANRHKESGKLFLKLAEFIYSKKRYKEVFEPIVSDMREEEAEARSQNRFLKAHWIKWHGRYSFLKAMGFGSIVWWVALVIGKWFKAT